MSIKNCLRFSLPVVALLAFAGIAGAQTATVPHLTINATVQNALRLDISSSGGGVDGTGSASDFVIDIGNINALGIGTPATGVTAVVTPGAGAAGYAVYTTPIILTPVFSGYGAGTATVGLTVGGGTNDATAVEGSSAVGATVAAARVVIASSLSDVANTRYVGFKVNKTEATGSRDAVFLYTVTMN